METSSQSEFTFRLQQGKFTQTGTKSLVRLAEKIRTATNQYLIIHESV